MYRNEPRRPGGALSAVWISQEVYLLKGEHWRVSRETVRRLRQREGLQVRA